MSRFSQSILTFRTTAIIALIVGFSLCAQGQDISTASGSGSNEIKVEVFPNPTSEQITIDLTKANIQQPKIEIRSIIGSKMNIFLEKVSLNKYKVNVSAFPRGYYLVLVREDRSKFQQTIRFSKK